MYFIWKICIHNVWKWTYIMVIGNCHFRMSCTWQYLIGSQVLYGWALNTDFLFDNRYWNDVYLKVQKKFAVIHLESCYVVPYVANWPVWLNGLMFVYKRTSCGFESCCCHLNFRYGSCFEQKAPWNSGKLQSLDSLWNLYVIWW